MWICISKINFVVLPSLQIGEDGWESALEVLLLCRDSGAVCTDGKRRERCKHHQASMMIILFFMLASVPYHCVLLPTEVQMWFLSELGCYIPGCIMYMANVKRPDVLLLGKCFSMAIGMEQWRHPVAGCVNGRWVRVPLRELCWGFI